MCSIKNKKGFAVLVSALLLSIAGIAFTTNMASTQLIDNQVIANYYRNNEAFINAESGINMLLSKIDDSSSILVDLPFTYQPIGGYYRVQVERLTKNSVEISSLGLSSDGSAEREIHLQIYHETTYNIPLAAVSTNGKVHLRDTATINEGCEGVSAANCNSPGNIAKYQLISNPTNETQEIADCTGLLLGHNQIDKNALYTDPADNNVLAIGKQISVVDEFGNTTKKNVSWPNHIPEGARFYGGDVAKDLSASTLFESIFGLAEKEATNALLKSSSVATIDMNNGVNTSCSKRLDALSGDVTTIYIQGDCDIDQNDALPNLSSANKHFTIGTAEHPKLVFIEGGTFISPPNTGASIIGMLYFLPQAHNAVDENGNAIFDKNGEQVLVKDQSINMGGIHVNGALLSEYNCSHDGGNKKNASGTNMPFSTRYDKMVLNKLYQDLGFMAIDSGYRFVEGSWRDF